MAGLGTAPKQGEEGFATGEAPSYRQQAPDQPAELVHTTAVEDVNFLIRQDYIYQGTYTLDTTMLPGYVFFILSLHPRGGASNQYIAHVSEMFNAWTGTAEARARFVANAFNGGVFRIAYIPPNISEESIRSMSLATLTAYPNIDLDPKNTDWIHVKGADERNVMFHWMADAPDSTKPETFGGYLVGFVAAPLVVGNLQGGAVQLYLEIKGDYFFLQPNPNFQKSSGQFAGPLSQASLNNVADQAGCDDQTSGNSKLSGIQICATTTRSIGCGFGYGRGFNGGDPLQNSPSTTWYSQYWTPARVNDAVTPWSPVTLDTIHPAGADPPDLKSWYAYHHYVNSETLGTITNAELQAYGLPICEGPTAHPVFPQPNNTTSVLLGMSTDGKLIASNTTGPNFGAFTVFSTSTNTAPSAFPVGARTFQGNRSRIGTPINVSDAAIPGMSKPAPNSESIVLFVNTYLRTLNYQTKNMTIDLRNSNDLPTSTTYVYSLRVRGEPDPIMRLRLWPDGMWTAPPLTTDTLILKPNQEMYLQFEQTLPTGSLLPMLTSLERRTLREYSKAGLRDSSEKRLKAYSAL